MGFGEKPNGLLALVLENEDCVPIGDEPVKDDVFIDAELPRALLPLAPELERLGMPVELLCTLEFDGVGECMLRLMERCIAVPSPLVSGETALDLRRTSPAGSARIFGAVFCRFMVSPAGSARMMGPLPVLPVDAVGDEGCCCCCCDEVAVCGEV